MDYELMMNGNVKIGERAPEFEADSTMGKISLNDYKGKWLIQEILLLFAQQR